MIITMVSYQTDRVLPVGRPNARDVQCTEGRGC